MKRQGLPRARRKIIEAVWVWARITARCEVCGRLKRKGKHKLYLWVPIGDEADLYETVWVHYPCWKRLLAGQRPPWLTRKVRA